MWGEHLQLQQQTAVRLKVQRIISAIVEAHQSLMGLVMPWHRQNLQRRRL